MEPPSQTPEGEPNHCPVCGKEVRIEPSAPPGDAPCPHCGCLLWFGSPGQSFEQTERQIRALVAEIAAFSKSNLPSVEFFGEFLNRVVAALAATGGAIWTSSDGGPLALQYQINLQKTNLPENEENQKRHSHLLRKALSEGEGMLVPPRAKLGEEDEAGNPTDFLLVLGPLRAEPRTVGLVEVFQRPEPGPTVQRAYLRFVLQMCELANDSPAVRALKK